jgi:hypothetical protein
MTSLQSVGRMMGLPPFFLPFLCGWVGEEDVGVSVGGGDGGSLQLGGLDAITMDQTYLYLTVCSLKSWYFFSFKRKAVCRCDTSSSS